MRPSLSGYLNLTRRLFSLADPATLAIKVYWTLQMRTWTIDQFEFEDPQSEEMLEVAVASRTAFPFANVAEFVAVAVGQQAARDLSDATPFEELSEKSTVQKYLGQFTTIELPSPCEWPTFILSDEWNERHFILCSPEGFVSYRWTTSA